MLRTGLAAAFATVLVGMSGGLARATPILPDATYRNVAHVTERNGLTLDQDTELPTGGLLISGAQTNLPFPVSWAASTSNDYTVPSLYASARNVHSDDVEAESDLTYFVKFTGSTATVPVRIQAHGQATAAENEAPDTGFGSGEIEATAFVQMFRADDFTSLVFKEVANSDAITNVGTHLFSLDQEFTLQTDLVYEVSMYASAKAASLYHANAFVDPLFTVPDGYSVQTSSNIGNSPATVTPIPATLPLFTSGLGGLGLIGWRRKKTAARAARSC